MPTQPAIPDYAQLATQTQASNQAAMNAQTTANRPNQTNQQGSLTWSQDPTTGQWTQTQALNSNLTNSANAQQGTQAGLLGGAQGLVPQAVQSLQNPMDTSGVQALPDAGFGAVQQVQDAMMSRLQPGMTDARNSLIQRLRSQGLSQDSDAYSRAIRGQDQSDVDARQQALMGATSAYGDIFNRSMDARRQGLGEAETARARPLNDIRGLMGAAGGVEAPKFNSFATSGNAGGVDYYGAGKDTFGDQLGQYNADTARAAGIRQGNINLGTTIGGGILDQYGPEIGTWLKGLFGG